LRASSGAAHQRISQLHLIRFTIVLGLFVRLLIKLFQPPLGMSGGFEYRKNFACSQPVACAVCPLRQFLAEHGADFSGRR
jgi:hypothetical protein